MSRIKGARQEGSVVIVKRLFCQFNLQGSGIYTVSQEFEISINSELLRQSLK